MRFDLGGRRPAIGFGDLEVVIDDVQDSHEYLSVLALDFLPT